MASDWQSVMGAVAKQALGAKAMRALTKKPKRLTRRRKASSNSRYSVRGTDRHAQIRRNYVESLELTNPGDGFADDDDDSDAEDYSESDDDESNDANDKRTAKRRGKPPPKRGRNQKVTKKETAAAAAGKRKKKKNKSHRQRYKSLAQVLTEHFTSQPHAVSGGGGGGTVAEPDYLSAASTSDGLPPRRFCYVTGQPARYRDAATGAWIERVFMV